MKRSLPIPFAAAALALALAGCTAAAPPEPVAVPTVDAAPLPVASADDQPFRLDLDGPPDAEEVEEFLIAVLEDADTKWTDYFVASGLQEPVVEYVIVGPGDDPFASACGSAEDPLVMESDTLNAFYCGADGSILDGEPVGAILLATETMQNMWSGDAFGMSISIGGDFGAALVVAHEFGHHITHELGTQLDFPELGHVMWFELLADCFAGVWTATVYADGSLETGDIDEAAAVLAVIGDAPGVVDHGTAEQRSAAFELGYAGDAEYSAGDPNSCIGTYWRTDDPTVD